MSPEIGAAPVAKDDSEHILELKDVSLTYDGGKSWVIEHFDLDVKNSGRKNGQFVVLLGQSGCGKSTILRFIAGLQKPTTGEVRLFGRPLADGDHVGMVFQQYSSFPWMSVLDNVALPLILQGVKKAEAHEKARAMLAKVDLAGHEAKYATSPLLSGGQLQRVAIARSLISDPRVILLDEPFGALDTNTRFKMQLLLASIWDELNNAIILVTHDIREAVFLGDEIYVMGINPHRLVKYIHVDLPLHRDVNVRRSAHFQELVDEVEDALWATIPGADSPRQ